jgi:hypothetical protein
MKINEVLTNDSEEIDEATPFGLGSRMKSAVMGKLGSTSAQAQGDVGKRANDLYKAFEYYASRSGVQMNSVPKATLAKWLTSQGLPTALPPAFKTVPVLNLTDKNTSTALWTGLAQGAYGAQMGSTGGAPGQATFGQQYGIPGRAPKPRPASAPAPAPAPPSRTTTPTTSYVDLKNELTAYAGTLTPAQKAELLNLLR